MATSMFRRSKFRGSRSGIGEDVNPSAYLVNLADCMLVLACGFMVSLIAYWSIDIGAVTKIEADDLKPVDPTVIADEVNSEGSNYVEAGVVYMDPATGNLYMVRDGGDTPVGDSAGGDGAVVDGSPSEQAVAPEGGGSPNTGIREQDIANSRASGAD